MLQSDQDQGINRKKLIDIIMKPKKKKESGETFFRWEQPCAPSDLVYFRQRIGESGAEKILDYRVARCFLKGALGASQNLLLAAAAWNLRKWILFALVFDLIQNLRNAASKAIAISRSISKTSQTPSFTF